jgi:hypothetical protein
MTEKQWLTSKDSLAMIKHLTKHVNERKRGLFACASCRLRLDEYDPKLEPYLAYHEEEAEGEPIGPQPKLPEFTSYDDPFYQLLMSVEICVRVTKKFIVVKKTLGSIEDCELGFHVTPDRVILPPLLREVFGNPFRPKSIDPAWLAWEDGQLRRLAQAAYEERQMPRGTLNPLNMSILADALEDAGCRDEDIIGHCRSKGPHVRGCWVVDLILGKEG